MSKLQITALILVVLMVLSGSSIFLQNFISLVLAFVREYSGMHPILVISVFLALSVAAVAFGPFTSVPLTPFAISVWGPVNTFFLLMLGWIIGNILAYALGLYLGYPVVRRFIEDEKLDRWKSFVREKVDVRIIFLFRLAVPAEAGYVFGILRYNFWKYMAIVIPAELPFAFLSVYGGTAFLQSNWIFLGLYGAVALALVFGSGFILKRFNRGKEV